MIIAVAGPYSAPTEAERIANLNALNEAAAMLLAQGHIPVVGVNAALPAVLQMADPRDAIMAISMAVIDNCEALLLIAESPGANKERDHILGKGLPVYYNIDDVPAATI